MEGQNELVILRITPQALRCRELPDGRLILLRSRGLLGAAPGEILTVQIAKRWTYGTQECVSGEVGVRRLSSPDTKYPPPSAHSMLGL
jgi:hypothetical protein